MGGDWMRNGMAPFPFLNYASGSDPRERWPYLYQSDSSSTTAPGFHNRNRAFSDGGGRRQPKVVTIPVQDGSLRDQKRPDKLHPSDKFLATSPKSVSVAPLQKTESVISDPCREVMSKESAATLIQSYFRGFLVRRTAPLIKLLIISSITSQIRLFKAQILADDFVEELGLHPKEHLKLSEAIMNLLLRLGSLQGVHATVREIRKSAVREAVALQEMIDSKLQQNILESNLQYQKAMPTTECDGYVDAFDTSFAGSYDQDSAVKIDSRVSSSLEDSENKFEHSKETIFEVGGQVASDAEYKNPYIESDCHDMESKEALVSKENISLTSTLQEDETDGSPRNNLNKQEAEGEDFNFSESKQASNENVFLTSALQQDKTDDCPRDNLDEQEADDDDVNISEKRMVKSSPTSSEELSRNRFDYLNGTISEEIVKADAVVLPEAEDKTARMESVYNGTQSEQASERNENNSLTSALQEGKTDALPKDQESEDSDDVYYSDEKKVESASTSEEVDDWCQLEYGKTSPASPDSCATSTEISDPLETLQKENDELKRILQQCRLTNQRHTSLICHLTERLAILEKQLQYTTKSTAKLSSNCKKRSKNSDRVSERRTRRINRTRNSAWRSRDFWLEDESRKVWRDDDDKQDNLD